MLVINLYWELLAAFGFTSFALYIFMIATIIRFRQHTEFRSSFFGLWLSLAVADSLHFIHSYVLLRFPRLGVFYNFFNAHRTGLLPKCSILFSYYFFCVQLLGNLLFALNRYTALSKMSQHEQFWSQGKRFGFIIAAQWIIPVFLVIQVIGQDVVYQTLPTSNYSLVARVSPTNTLINCGIVAVAAVLVMIGCACLYTATIFAYMKHKATIPAAMHHKNKPELRLLAAAIIVFVCLAVYAIFQTLVAYFSFTNEPLIVNAIYSQWYLINDIFALISCWSLLLTCSTIREFMLKMLPVKTHSIGPTSSFPQRKKTNAKL